MLVSELVLSLIGYIVAMVKILCQENDYDSLTID